MATNRIVKLQEEYYQFCLTLLRYADIENRDIKELLETLLKLKVQMSEELETNLKNFKSEAILAVESEIGRLRAGESS